MLSQTGVYALRAVLLIAQSGVRGERLTSVQIAAELGLPQNYLSKTLHRLVKHGVLASSRGPTGGFDLARPPEEIPIADVVGPFQELEGPRRCLLEDRPCDPDRPCAAHSRWERWADQIAEMFHDTTVADFLQRGPKVVSSARPGPDLAQSA